MGWFDKPLAVRSSERTAILAAAMAPPRQEPAQRAPRSGLTGLSVARMLFSGETGRLTGDWPTTPVPADWIIYRYQRILVARSREQAANNDFMRAFLRLNRQGIVGSTGVMFQSQAKTAAGKATSTPARRLRRRSPIGASASIATSRASCPGGRWQAACAETAARDGEFMVRKVFGKAAGKYGFALQFIDPQRCPVDFDRAELEGGGFIRHGIEFNAYGKPVAYYFTDQVQANTAQAYSYGGKSYRRVPADEILHGFIAELPGQKRGLPWLTTGLFRAKQMSATEDAAGREHARRRGQDGVYPVQGRPRPGVRRGRRARTGRRGGRVAGLAERRGVQGIQSAISKRRVRPFMKFMLRSMAAGGGVSYENLSQDREGVNYTSIRHGKLDEVETFKERQEWLVEELCEGVVDAWLPRALLTGRIVTGTGKTLTADQIDRLSPRKWQPRRWDWTDPKSDIAAQEKSKNNFFSSLSQTIRERGKDPHQVWAEIGQDIAAMRECGIPDSLIALSFGEQPEREAPAENAHD